MLVPLFGLGILLVIWGVATLLFVWGKKDEDTVFMHPRYGGVFPASARFARYEGRTLVVFGVVLSIVSLLIRG